MKYNHIKDTLRSNNERAKKSKHVTTMDDRKPLDNIQSDIVSGHTIRSNRFPTGHANGSEVETPRIPDVIAGDGAFRSTANDLLKYLSANMGLLHTELDESISLQHLIQHPAVTENPMNYSEYVALTWRVLTNLGTETLTHQGKSMAGILLLGLHLPNKQEL